MAGKREGVRNISLQIDRSTFSTIFHLFSRESLFSELSVLRNLLTNEKARIIHTIKEQRPQSLYVLAKKLGRDFKSVRQDVKTLEHFGIVKLVRIDHKHYKRKSLKPVLELDGLQINIKF